MNKAEKIAQAEKRIQELKTLIKHWRKKSDERL
jgi:hypothetical protein